MYKVYAVYNKKNNKIYIGQTENLEQRIKLHNSKEFENSYTAKFDGEWILLYSEQCEDRKKALLRERQLKSYQGRQFIKQNIPL